MFVERWFKEHTFFSDIYISISFFSPFTPLLIFCPPNAVSPRTFVPGFPRRSMICEKVEEKKPS